MAQSHPVVEGGVRRDVPEQGGDSRAHHQRLEVEELKDEEDDLPRQPGKVTLAGVVTVSSLLVQALPSDIHQVKLHDVTETGQCLSQTLVQLPLQYGLQDGTFGLGVVDGGEELGVAAEWLQCTCSSTEIVSR